MPLLDFVALHRRADELLGAPFRAKGRDPATGVDCTWVTLELFKAMGHPLPDPGETDYAAEAFETFGDRLREVSHPSVGDLVVLYRAGFADHAAVVVRNDYVVHATAGMGVRRTKLAVYARGWNVRYYRAA